VNTVLYRSYLNALVLLDVGDTPITISQIGSVLLLDGIIRDKLNCRTWSLLGEKEVSSVGRVAG
jgi:hypothetical protein